MLSDTELAIAATDAGAAVVRAKYGSRLTRFAKSATDFATDADVDAERVILNLLRQARPGDQLVGEESGTSNSGDGDRTWLIDPLCGTLNYAAQTPLVAVNVALRHNGRIIAAASADPFSREVFWTDGTRACLRSNGRDEPLRPAPDSALVDVNLDAPFPNAGRFRAVDVLADPHFTERFGPRVVSTTLALAWVAAGRRAGYLTDGRLLDSVHFSSGIALCEAAGCIVTGLRGQQLHTGVEGLVAAADAETHAALLTLVAKQFARAR